MLLAPDFPFKSYGNETSNFIKKERRNCTCPLKRVNNSLRKVRSCYGNFLLAETEVVMTTLISSSHVKDKNRFFTGHEIFLTGKFVVFHRYIFIIKGIILLA